MARGTCWQGYEQKGFKKKGNKSVPNCVKVGTMKGDMIKKPVKAFKGLAVEIFEKTDKGKSFPLGVMGASNLFKKSQTARDIGSQLGLAPKALSDYYQKKEDDKRNREAPKEEATFDQLQKGLIDQKTYGDLMKLFAR